MLRTVVSILFLILMVSFSANAEQDKRIHVEMPAMMKSHMLSNMRDHLVAIQSILGQLAKQNYDAAADIAEQRLGMSSLDDHGAAHMGKVMPKEMGQIGTGMHRAASRFAVIAKDESINGDPHKVFAALSDITQQCVACHSAYKIY